MDNLTVSSQTESGGEVISSPDSLALPWKILVGTHHKTGTVWLNSVFRNICISHQLKYRESDLDTPEDDQYDVLFHNASKFDNTTLSQLFRGIHVIRDPRDIIVSGCFYHLRSDEAWLFTPQHYLNGRTYKDTICQLENLDEQLLFEMENHGTWTISQICSWNYKNPSFFEVKYEELIEDSTLLIFRDIFLFLGFPRSSLPNLLSIAYQNSIFSLNYQNSQHIRSGKPNDWKQYFKPRHKEKFLELFGNVLIDLGYEKDNSWEGY